MAKTIGIDLGASNTFIYLKGKGVVMREPSMAAIEASSFKTVATGTDAKMIIGKTPGSAMISYPFSDGVTDYNTAVDVLTSFLQKMSVNGLNIIRPIAVCCVACGADEDECAALEDALIQAGCKEITLIQKPYAAALGAGLPITGNTPCMVVDIGSSSAEMAILEEGKVIASASTEVAGNMFSKALMSYIRRKFNIYITQSAADLLKHTYGTVNEKHDRGNAKIYGRDNSTGLPISNEISSPEIRGVLSRQIIKIAERILLMLDDVSERFADTIMENGITLTGGSALLDGIDLLLSEYLGTNVVIAGNPIDCVVEGLGFIIDNGLIDE